MTGRGPAADWQRAGSGQGATARQADRLGPSGKAQRRHAQRWRKGRKDAHRAPAGRLGRALGTARCIAGAASVCSDAFAGRSGRNGRHSRERGAASGQAGCWVALRSGICGVSSCVTPGLLRCERGARAILCLAGGWVCRKSHAAHRRWVGPLLRCAEHDKAKQDRERREEALHDPFAVFSASAFLAAAAGGSGTGGGGGGGGEGGAGREALLAAELRVELVKLLELEKKVRCRPPCRSPAQHS